MSNDKANAIIDGVLAGAQAALGITPEQHLRWCLNRISDLESDVEKARAELHSARTKAHSDEQLIKAADLVHIRLRAGLREALDAHDDMQAWVDSALDYRDEITAMRLRMYELRKLLGGGE